MQQEEKGKNLLQKYLNGKANAEEQAIIESWQLDFPLQERESLDDETALTDLAEIRQELVSVSSARKTSRLWLAAAATAFIMLSTGLWFYYVRHKQEKDPQNDLYASNIGPGKNSATLTLANGKILKLNGAKSGVVIDNAGLRYSDGTLLGTQAPSSVPEAITAATPKGGTYQVTLPDGTRVWLNSASEIRFPSSFTGQKRQVALTGEAYFEVAKLNKPFIVSTDKQEVKVLGTHFNINSYADEMVTTTTLLEGAVQVSSGPGNTVNLRPGQQSVLSGQALRVNAADTDMAIAWKEGYFKFKNESVPAIMRKLSRWYDVEVSYRSGLSNETFGGKISRSKTLAEVLEMLQSTRKIHFKIEGRRVIVQ
ncbi:FecR family protein [Pedobacter africanus]|uniref:FecR family protein n=1 Tax=Pedobacter africanus TaxID=151894 RepID=A0A1W2DWI1_9SPHI|nr:FecR family protein [Pedobacter africanus]SMD01850.1 FecR family protein [Pedobacter africanus]